MRPFLLIAAVAPLLAVAHDEVYVGYDALNTNPWTLAINLKDSECKTTCTDNRLVHCTGRNACDKKNLYHKQACTVTGYNEVVNCANCAVQYGLIDTQGANDTLKYLVGNCSDSTLQPGVTPSAATSSLTALSPTATGGSLNMPQPTAGALRNLPAWSLGVAGAVLAAML